MWPLKELRGFNQRTILLTGVTGFLGSHLALALLERGCRLKVLVRRREGDSVLRLKRIFDATRPTPLVSYLLSGQLDILHGDVTDRYFGLSPQTLLALTDNVTDILHCAAIVSFDPSRVDELQRVNVEGTKHVLEFAKISRATLYDVSTAFVAGRRAGRVAENNLDGAAGFNNAYEESKFLAELAVHKAMANGLPAVILRPSILVGHSQTGQTQSFIGFYTLLRALAIVTLRSKRDLEHRPSRTHAEGLMWWHNSIVVPLRVVGSESKTLNIIPIDYAVRIVLSILRDPENVGQTFHVINPSPPTIGQLRDWMCLTLGMRGVSLVPPSEFETRPMNRWERLFARNTDEYTPYLQREEPQFLDDNTRQVARREEIPLPMINAQFIGLLTAYCQESQWGKRRVRIHEPQPLPSRST